MLIAIIILVASVMLIRLIGVLINRMVPRGGISESGYVDINGSRQWISIYGKNRNNPVLLYLHGGPGSATSPSEYAFIRKWSDVYTVVTWDQRGAGRSYDPARGNEKITRAQLLKDGKEMSEFLLQHLGVKGITLLGHSWGSMFGANLALAYPEYYDAFIGTGMCIDIRENERRLYEAAGRWVTGDEEGKKLLARMDPDQGLTMEYIEVRNAIMKRYGYDMMKDGTDYSLPLTVFFNPYYSLFGYIRYLRYARRSLRPYLDFMADELPKFSLYARYDYAMPYFNINGDRDYQTNWQMANEYFERVRAPFKKMYVMKDATHGLLESRSGEFSAIMHDIAGIMKRLADPAGPEEDA